MENSVEKKEIKKTKNKGENMKTLTVKATPKNVAGKKSTMDFALTSQGFTKKELQEVSSQLLKTLLREDATQISRKIKTKEVKK